MKLAGFQGKQIFLSGLCQLALLVAVAPLWAGEAVAEKRVASETEQIKAANDDEAGFLGIAHYYAKRYHGRKTSSGDIHDSRKLTAAHPTLPLGTRVKVVNLANKRSIIVTVNDRCRKHRTPFIDLSRQAAKDLGFFHHARANVRIIPLGEDEPSSAETSEPDI